MKRKEMRLKQPTAAPESLLHQLRQALPAILADIGELVSCESPSRDLSAVQASAAVVGQVGKARMGMDPEYIVVDGCTHVRWRFGQQLGPRVLVLGHHDTVWPIGTVGRRPFSVRDGIMRGPGCFDMKTGLGMAFHAIASLGQHANVTLLVTGDEEIGSQTSRHLIEEEARSSSAVLVLEGASEDGAIKIARKGARTYRIAIKGRASHAGLAPDRGISATLELAHKTLAIHALSDQALETTVTPTLASAGTTTNTVAAEAECFVDVRAWTPDEQQRVDKALRSLTPHLEGAEVEVMARPSRPPMTTDVSALLFDRAQVAAQRLGLEPLVGASVGGASDANITAALGIPTLDGLGAVGDGAHSEHEHVLVRPIPERTALLTQLISDLLSDNKQSQLERHPDLEVLGQVSPRTA